MDYKAITFLLFLFIGVAGVVLASAGVSFPIAVSSLILVLSALTIWRLYSERLAGPLLVLLFVAYALPFIHVFPYLWFDFDKDYPDTLWGLVANFYMRDRETIELMAMIGAIGATGFVIAGLLLRLPFSPDWSSQMTGRNQRAEKTLRMPGFVVWVSIAVLMSWLAAPSKLVFEAAYTQSAAISSGWNFSSAWMISYVMLIFALSDSLFEKSARVRRAKLYVVVTAVLFVVVWLQLLRGDRESVPLVIAMLLMFFAWGKQLHGKSKGTGSVNWYMPAAAVVVLLVASFLVGALRHSLVGVDRIVGLATTLVSLSETGVIRVEDLAKGTWTGALLTPLSVAGDYVRNLLPLNLGKDYVNLIASIMPGFVADWVGYVRPIDATKGPAWQMTFGMGGTHAVVLPFMNFRMGGVFVIIAVWAIIVGMLENRTVRRLTIARLSLLGTMALAIPHWFWYGEKYIINAVLIWLFFSLAHRLRFNTSANRLGATEG